MDTQNINVSVEPKEGVSTLLIGEALTPKEPKKLIINGNFRSVSEFVNKRKDIGGLQSVNPTHSIVICNKDEMTIHLMTDPNNPFGTEVIGKAEYSEEFINFGINQNKFFNREQLIKLFKFNRRFFPNKEEYADLLYKYQKFSASVKKEIVADTDQRGNVNKQFQKDVTTDLPPQFLLNIPIFKEEMPSKFPVEICLEEYEGGVRFWFESVELHEILEEDKEAMFNFQINNNFKDLPIIFE